MKKILSTTLLLVCLLSTSCVKHGDNSSPSSTPKNKDNENYVKDYMKDTFNLLYNNQGNASSYCEKYFLIENESEKSSCIYNVNTVVSYYSMHFKDATISLGNIEEVTLSALDEREALEGMPAGTEILTAFSVYCTTAYTIIDYNERYQTTDEIVCEIFKKGTKKFIARIESL